MVTVTLHCKPQKKETRFTFKPFSLAVSKSSIYMTVCRIQKQLETRQNHFTAKQHHTLNLQMFIWFPWHKLRFCWRHLNCLLLNNVYLLQLHCCEMFATVFKLIDTNELSAWLSSFHSFVVFRAHLVLVSSFSINWQDNCVWS